jgi:hypothetical protein
VPTRVERAATEARRPWGRTAGGRRAAAALRSGSSEKEGGDRILTLGRSSGGRELDGEGGGSEVQHRRPVFTGGDGELRKGRTGACGFNRMQGLAHTCEGEVNGRVQGASPTADEHGRQQWRGGRRFTAVAQAARAREALGLGVKRRGRCGVLWGCLYRPGRAPGGGSPAAWPLTAAALIGS